MKVEEDTSMAWPGGTESVEAIIATLLAAKMRNDPESLVTVTKTTSRGSYLPAHVIFLWYLC